PQRFERGTVAFKDHGAYTAAVEFFETWQQKRWGLMPRMISAIAGDVTPRDIKNEYSHLPLGEFCILEIEEKGASAVHTLVELRISGRAYSANLRWLHESDDGSLVIPGRHAGAWRLVFWGAAHMVERSADT